MPGRIDGQRTELRAVRVGERNVNGLGALKEGRGSAPGAIDELVGDDEMAGFIMPGEAPGCGGTDDPIHPCFLEGPQVGPVGDQVGRKLVVLSVARKKSYLHPCNRPNRQRSRRVAVGRGHGDLLGVRQELVETGPPDDSDHESLLSELLFFEPLGFASVDLLLDFTSLDFLLDFSSSDLELAEVEPLDRVVLDFDLLDLESVT
jgi:hypothetical protein